MSALTDDLQTRLAFLGIVGGVFGVHRAGLAMFQPLAIAGLITLDEGIAGHFARLTEAGRAALSRKDQAG